MISGPLPGIGLYDALHLCEFGLAAGTLRVDGGGRSGAIHLAGGFITFGEMTGRRDELVERHGISLGVWNEAVTRSSGNVAGALIDAGTDPGRVRRFVQERIERAVAELATLPDPRLEVDPTPGWFGDSPTFQVPAVVDVARLINMGGDLIGEHVDEAVVALCPTNTPVTLPPDHWNVVAGLLDSIELSGLVESIGRRRAMEFVRFLQMRSLASTMKAAATIGGTPVD